MLWAGGHEVLSCRDRHCLGARELLPACSVVSLCEDSTQGDLVPQMYGTINYHVVQTNAAFSPSIHTYNAMLNKNLLGESAGCYYGNRYLQCRVQ